MREYLTTKEVAELLRIKERKVYDLAAAGEIPCSRALGKLLFPREALTAWIAGSTSGAPRPGARSAVFLGSHDPLLEWALRESRCGLATYFDGSHDGLARFAAGEGVATGLHIFDPQSGSWNTHAVTARLAGAPVVLVEWAWRERGLIVAQAGGAAIRGLADLRGRRLAPRQAEAASQSLLEHMLGEAGIGAGEIELVAAARNETDAALAVREGKADVAFGLLPAARQYRLGFVPLVRERFDLLVDRRAWFEPPFQAFLAFCRSERFAARAGEMEGYDASALGTVRFNGP